MKIDLKSLGKILLFCALVYPPLFLHLDVLPIREYDESRLANNAIEMIENGKLLVPYYDGEPDMWNTKPPLLIWIQALFHRIIGPSELAARLPVALAGLLTAFVLMLLGIRYLKSYWFGLISVLVLLTSIGYLDHHASHTGDYDVPLTLFITLYSLSAFAFSQTGKGKFLTYFFIFLSLGTMTKGIQALIMLPMVLIFTAIAGWKKMNSENWKRILIGATIFLITVLGYYLVRELVNPGYLKAVWENELGGRYGTVIESHAGPFLFYYKMLTRHHFNNWYQFLPFGLLIGIFSKDSRLRNLAIFSGSLSVWYWLIISNAQTKLQWYALPLYPFLAILVSVVLFTGFEILKNSDRIKGMFTVNILPIIFLYLMFQAPYSTVLDKVYFPKEYSWDKAQYDILHYLKKGSEGRFRVDGQTLCYDGYLSPFLFYQRVLNSKGQNIYFKSSRELSAGDTVTVSDSQTKERITAAFEVERSHIYGLNVERFVVSGKKDD